MDYTNLTPELSRIIREMIEQNPEFSNVARPKPTKASASSNPTQKTWGGKENAKPSTATQGSWDAVNTPGGVSSFAKETWTKDQMAAYIAKQVAFGNKPFAATGKASTASQSSWKSADDYKYGKTSTSTQASWKTDDDFKYGKVSTSTQASWKQGTKDATVLRYNAGSIKKFTEI